MSQFNTDNIPYEEYRAINALWHSHPTEHEAKLRALIVWGDLVATGQSSHINVLEVLEEWSHRRHVIFSNSPSIPQRSQLHVYFLTCEEFENTNFNSLPKESFSSKSLLAAVRESYAILFEKPEGYAQQVLNRRELPHHLVSDGEMIEDPQTFFSSVGSLGP